jgi:hypothetical protein
MQARLVQVRDLVRQWKVIIDASRGAEIPSASDLFTIYTEVLNIEESSASTLQTNKLNDRSSVELITAATAVTRAQTKLLPLIETLQYAVADRIESEEARCAKNLRNFGRK